MNKKYYLEYYKYERQHWFFLARNEIIMSCVNKQTQNKKGLSILNIGTATGRTSELLESYGKVKSIEYDKDCLAFTKNKLPHLDLDHGDITSLNFPDESFDIVCAFDVVEHVENDHLAVTEMKRVCKKGGTIISTVPAFNFLWSQHDDINMHFRRYTKNGFKKLYQENGKIEFASYFNFILFFPILLYRKLISPYKKASSDEDIVGQDFNATGNNGLLNTLLRKIFNFDKFFVKNYIPLPVGVSVILTWKKTTQ